MTEETEPKEIEIEEPKVEEAKAESDATPEDPQEGTDNLASQDFSSFIFSISTTVLMDLGELEHPINKEKKVNLKMAKHSIDVIDMLKTKTEGNLTDRESTLITNILTDLKIRYSKLID
ncbi:MAG: DUF1844 domain-containing protein [Thermodesulfobacteriota bacterium]